MSKALERILIFALGGGAGSLITWRMLKDYYDTKTRNDVESVKRRYAPKESIQEEKEEPEQQYVPTKPDLKTYVETLKEQNYLDYSQYSNKEDDEEEEVRNYPIVIPPDEFGEDEDYECISLTYFSDGVLVDDADEIISDVEAVVSHESLEHFGEYEDDAVYVRNDNLRNYYEILRDERTYSDLLDDKPHLIKET